MILLDPSCANVKLWDAPQTAVVLPPFGATDACQLAGRRASTGGSASPNLVLQNLTFVLANSQIHRSQAA